MVIRRGLHMITMVLLLTFVLDSPRLVSAGGLGGLLVKGAGHIANAVIHNLMSGSHSLKPSFLKSSSPSPSPSPSPSASPSPSLDSLEGKDECTYIITVNTTCTKEAGTTDPVSLRFGDSSSVDIMVLPLSNRLVEWLDSSNQNSTNRPFQACSVDEFRVNGPCVNTTICFLYLKLSGADSWQPVYARVRVEDMPDLNSGYFYFRRYLPRGTWIGQDVCDSEVTPFGIKRNRRV